MIHEFGWAEDDWDRIAAGVIAATSSSAARSAPGGNFTDWQLVESYHDMGYPLVEAHADGSFIVTKHPNTGGLVSLHTVSEQLMYEIGTPEYIAPDCIARFDSIHLESDGPDRVRVTGAKGAPAPEKLKVSISFSEGYRAFGRLLISGLRRWKRRNVFPTRSGTPQEARTVMRMQPPAPSVGTAGTLRPQTSTSRPRSCCRSPFATTISRRSSRNSLCNSCRGFWRPCRASPTSPIRDARGHRASSGTGQR